MTCTTPLVLKMSELGRRSQEHLIQGLSARLLYWLLYRGHETHDPRLATCAGARACQMARALVPADDQATLRRCRSGRKKDLVDDMHNAVGVEDVRARTPKPGAPDPRPECAPAVLAALPRPRNSRSSVGDVRWRACLPNGSSARTSRRSSYIEALPLRSEEGPCR